MSLLLTICLISAIVQVAYLAVLLFKINRYDRPKIQLSVKKPVSVIICARNEASNLKKYLPVVLQQDYPDFEVVVVNDSSNDGTQDVLQALTAIYSHLSIVCITDEQKQFPGKKGALAHGIATAKHDFLLMTDADCEPASDKWLEQMTLPLHTGADMSLGISPYLPGNGLVNALVRYETLLIAIQYIGMALWRKPYMGVGRNMAYTRALYKKVNGFEGLTETASGDDDLFVQKVIDQAVISVVIDEQAFTWSATPLGISAWWNQKTRHYSTGRRYKAKTLWLLGLFSVSKLIFWITVVNLMLSFFAIGVIICIVFHILHSIMVRPLALKLKTLDIRWQFLLLDLLYIVTVTTTGWTTLQKKSYSWK
jgi:poly-beta-1,6-N-acetyl-D-glucosamine synthase